MRTLLSFCLAFFFLQNVSAQCDQVIDQPIIINEIGSYVEGGADFHVNAEYIELLVIGKKENPFAKMNLAGYKIDDNNFIALGIGNEPGHIVFSSNFPKVAPGSLILIYNPEGNIIDQSMDGLPNADGVYQVPISHESLIKCEGYPSNIHDRQYNGCNQPYRGENWDEFIPFRNAGDVAQIRDNAGKYIHAISWWKDMPISYPEQSIEFANTSLKNKSVQFIGENYNEKESYQVLSGKSPGAPNSEANNDLIEKLSIGVNQNKGNLEAEVTQFPSGSESNGIINLSLFGIESDAKYSVSLNGNTYVSPNGVSQFEGLNLDLHNIGPGEYEIEIQFDYSECTLNASIVVPDEQVEATETCDGECVTLDSDNIDPDLLSSTPCISWMNADGDVISHEESVEICPEGTEEITQYIENEDGVIIKTVIHIVGFESSSYFISSNIPDGCPASDITLNISGDEYSSILWSNGDSNETLSVAEAGVYSVTVTSDNGCEYKLTTKIPVDSFLDSDGDGVCDSEDCAPYAMNDNIDSDEDGVCDFLDCAPNNIKFWTDTDGDGVCDNIDCEPLNSSISTGGLCDDFNACTKNDIYNNNCECVGEEIPNCSIDETNEECEYGLPCDDNNPCTYNDLILTNCQCIGTYIYDCNECDPGSPCDDNNVCTTDDKFDDNCNCEGGSIQDCEECEKDSLCDDNNPCTINDKITSDCKCIGSDVVSIDIIASKDGNCEENLVKLSVQDQTLSITWKFEESIIGYDQNEIYVNTSGTYVATVATGGCIYENSFNLSFEDFSQEITISSSSTTICNSDQTIELSIDNDKYSSPRWTLEGIQIGFDHEIKINVQGIYSVVAFDKFGCPKESSIEINSNITDTKIKQQNPLICHDEQITLSIQENESFQNIIWKFEGVEFSNNGKNPYSINVNIPGIYSVEIESNSGCTSKDEVIISTEEDIDIDKILVDAGFVKEPVTIHSNTPTLKSGTQSNDRDSQLDDDQANSYSIIRHKVNPNSEPVDLSKLIQNKMDLYSKYDENVEGKLIDKFCPKSQNFIDIDEFLEFSEKQSNFAYYIISNDVGETTFIYYKSPNTPKKPIQNNGHGEVFKDFFYKLLCNVKHGINTKLTSNPTNLEDRGLLPPIDAPTTYIQTGPISLPNLITDKHFFNSPIGYEPNLTSWVISEYQRGILVSNFIQDAILLTDDKANISIIENVKSVKLTKHRFKSATDFFGDFVQVKIKYDENTIPLLQGQTELLDEEKFLYINIIKSDYEAFDNLFNNSNSIVNSIINGVNLPFSTFTLPACLYEKEDLCDMLNTNILILDDPMSKVVSFLDWDRNSDSRLVSENIINCFENNNLVNKYLKTSLSSNTRVPFYGNLTFHTFNTKPLEKVKFYDDSEEFLHLVEFETIDKTTLKIEYAKYIKENGFQIYSKWNISKNLWFETWTQTQNRKINYFDSNLSTTDREFYPLKISKKYNFISAIPQEPYNNNEYKLLKVPGIYLAYAHEKILLEKKQKQIKNNIDIALIMLSFGNLSGLVAASRLARMKAYIATIDITLTASKILLRNADYCDQAPTFCENLNKFIEISQFALLTGKINNFAYSMHKNANTSFKTLNTFTKKKILDNLSPDLQQPFIDIMSYESDIVAELKNMFYNIESISPGIIEELIDAIGPKYGKIILLEKSIKDLDEISPLLPLNGKGFFEKLIQTADIEGKIGKDLLNLSEGGVSVWKDLKDFEVSAEIALLNKVANAVKKGIPISKIQEDLIDIMETDNVILKNNWIETIDNEEYIVLRRGTDKWQEIQYFGETGYLFSAAARTEYQNSEGDIEASLAHSNDIHNQWLDIFNNDITAYALAHAQYGNQLESIYGLKLTLIPTTSLASQIDNYYTPGVGSKYIGIVKKENILHLDGETEYLIIGGSSLFEKI